MSVVWGSHAGEFVKVEVNNISESVMTSSYYGHHLALEMVT